MVPTTPTDGEDHGNSYCYSGESSPSSDAVTNWQIAHGSLESAVTFESSDSPIDPDSIPKSPVIVKPPSLDSGPCEIKSKLASCFSYNYWSQEVNLRLYFLLKASILMIIWMRNSFNWLNLYFQLEVLFYFIFTNLCSS